MQEIIYSDLGECREYVKRYHLNFVPPARTIYSKDLKFSFQLREKNRDQYLSNLQLKTKF